MNELFLKNTQALFEKDQPLALKLRELKQCQRFELIQQSSDNLDINILDKENKDFIYNNALKELEENLKFYNDEYLRYPVLFFYGLGNGILYKALLSNPIRTHLVIFEKELEIFYLVFHYLDLSEEIRSERIIFLQENNYANIISLFEKESISILIRTYALHAHNKFYEKYFSDEILNTNSINIRSIKHIANSAGNDVNDSLQGINQLLYNLKDQLEKPSLKDLLNARSNARENAIIVSTGPSLIKQLPLLKQIQNKASIFCADSAYAILAKHDIKPDYVLMLERSDFTCEFFNNSFDANFNENITFILASVSHPKAIEYLKKDDRFFLLAHRPLPFAKSLNMNDYGYLGSGMSVANMAYELAIKLNHKNIILIGQDLAYGEDGNSHPKDYLYNENSENAYKNNLFVKAYSGNGEVETNYLWYLFKNTFEKDIDVAKNINITTYNATEGGARIEGAKEVPFKPICDELLKARDKILKPILKQNKNTLDEIKKLLKNNIKESKTLIADGENLLQDIDFSLEKCEFKDLKKDNENFVLLLQKIDDFKQKILNNTNLYFFNELQKPLLFHYECLISEIFVKNFTDESEKMQKNISLLNANKTWIKQYLQILEIQNQEVEAFLSSKLSIYEKPKYSL